MLHLQGQLSPSKSIGGVSVYGLAGRLTVVAGVSGAASSLGSRGGSFRVGLIQSQLQVYLRASRRYTLQDLIRELRRLRWSHHCSVTWSPPMVSQIRRACGE